MSRWSQKKPVLWPPSNWTRNRTPFSWIVTRGGSFGLASGRPGKSSASAIRSSTWTRKCFVPSRSAEQVEDRADPLVDPQAEDLDREDVVEPVDDQAGEAVGLGVDDPVGVGRLVEPEEVAAEGDGPVDPAFPEVAARAARRRRRAAAG